MSYNLTPMYGLGSQGRVFGSIAISSPRTKIGSVNRVYGYIKKTQGAYVAIREIEKSVYGPYQVYKGRLIYV
jgi:hypothetical protein